MTGSSQLPLRQRAPRVNLRGRMSAIVKLENGRKLPAKLHQLSVTGGLMEIPASVQEHACVELTLEVGLGIVRAKAEMLFPMWGSIGFLQPFRFIEVHAEQAQILATGIASLLAESTIRAAVHQGLGYRQPRFFLESF
jgi:hypothetical protein